MTDRDLDLGVDQELIDERNELRVEAIHLGQALSSIGEGLTHLGYGSDKLQHGGHHRPSAELAGKIEEIDDLREPVVEHYNEVLRRIDEIDEKIKSQRQEARAKEETLDELEETRQVLKANGMGDDVIDELEEEVLSD